MRYVALLVALVFFGTLNAQAQLNTSNSVFLASSYFAVPAETTESTVILTPSPFANSGTGTPSTASGSSPIALSLIPTPAAPPQDVTSVFQHYGWQFYLGYSFFRFYEVPAYTQNMNGFDYGVVYYFNNWVGAEGNFSATHATQFGQSSWFVSGEGGPRFRWAARRGTEVWVHTLLGYSHFTPQTPNGGQNSIAYQLGGGVDLPFKPRWAFQIGADAVGSRYFSTYQFSPKFTVGVVFKY